MSSRALRPSVLLFIWLVSGGIARAQTPKPAPPDLATQPTLYVVPYAHLDTQWRWDYPTTINEYIPNTMRQNFALFEKYPRYVFNFSGARRYLMMKEYYPAEYAKVRAYVAAGRWFPSGSSMEENDVNSPSAESLIRQILYGKQVFRAEFGRTSAEYMLPDCFGFPASLPSVLAHAGIKGFSTQKLSWNSAKGIPFNVGVWEGLDGRTVVAALNAMNYSGDVRHDLTKSPPPPEPGARALVDWPKRIRENGEKGGLLVDFHYYGVGDVGGAPREPSVRLMDAILARGTAVVPPPQPTRQGQAPPPGPPPQEVVVGDGPVRVLQGSAEQMFLDITADAAAKLPRYKGDLMLIEHSAGSITSQAYLKRWNRHNELLADAAERASVAAAWLGGRAYPIDRLNEAWTLVMGSQMHDILPGTSIPRAYEYAWNDEIVALNQFAGVLTSATTSIALAMNTQVKGTAIIVYNPLNIEREDVVEAAVSFPGGTPKAARVVGPDGTDVPAQISGGRVLFLAKAPPVGYAVYDVQAAGAAPVSGALKISESSLENGRYRIRLDQNGDVASLFDKSLDKELLSAPLRLAIKTDTPVDWPAWNMDWADQQKPPRAFVQGPAQVRITEAGPVRVALEVTREAEGSRFVQTIRLAEGDAGRRVEFGNIIDWKTSAANLKATFPLTASNPEATYNWDIGTIRRGNNDEKKFEVPSHQWFDLTDRSGAFGVTVLSDSKIASDKPEDGTLRLTLLRTPGIGTGNGRSYADQSTQDWGRHEITYGLAAHRGDWRDEQTDWQAQRLNQPLIAFEASKHAGALGRSFSLVKLGTSRLRVLALKRAEQSDEIVIRLVELDGRPVPGARVQFAAPVVAAREINGAEEPVGEATVTGGALVADFTPYQVRTFAVKLAASAVKAAPARSQPVTLAYDRIVTSPDGARTAGGMDEAGRSIPAERLPREIQVGGVRFALAPAGAQPNAVVARGQAIALPPGGFTRVHILAAAAEGDETAAFRVGARTVDLTIQSWSGFVGQWDNRTWNRTQETVPPPANAPAGTPPRTRTRLEYTGLTPGFVKPAPVAWFASHRHTAEGANEAYAYSYLFAYAIDLPAGATALTLPSNEKVRILAVTVSDETGAARPARALYDTLER